MNEGFFDESTTDKDVMALLREALRGIREVQKRWSREPEMVEMFKGDAEHLKTGMRLIREKRYGSALDHLESQDTAARDRVPMKVWGFLDQKVKVRRVLKKASEAPLRGDEPFVKYEFGLLDYLEANKLLKRQGRYGYGPLQITQKGKRLLAKPF